MGGGTERTGAGGDNDDEIESHHSDNCSTKNTESEDSMNNEISNDNIDESVHIPVLMLLSFRK